jgi:hypothetical protein
MTRWPGRDHAVCTMKSAYNQIDELDISSAFNLGYCAVATSPAPVYLFLRGAGQVTFSSESVTAFKNAINRRFVV